MTLSSRKFNGVKHFKRPQVYHTKKDANEAAEWWKDEGYNVHIVRSNHKIGKIYDYHLYTLKNDIV